MRSEDEVRRRLINAEDKALEPENYQTIGLRERERRFTNWRASVLRAETQRDMLRWVLGEVDPR